MLFLAEFAGETDLKTPDTISNAIRGLCAFLDRGVYLLLNILYKLFFNVASWQFFNEAVAQFFSRIQLIIGVYMLFQLAIVILRGILDPDTFGKNQSGGKGIIPRILTSLVMLVLLLPINAGSGNEFETRISNEGILFGTLSSLQYRIINTNTLGKLILGTNGTSDIYLSDDSSNDSDLDVSSRIFTATVLRTFYRINLIPYKERTHEEGKNDDMINSNRVCQNISDEIRMKYTRLDADPADILDYVNETCNASLISKGINAVSPIKVYSGKSKYMFNLIFPFISTVVGIIFCFILLSFTIDIAVRSIKLGLLRLLAPIPIISYMDPNGSKDSSFSAWGKTLVSTYLDLFVRLASIYFVIFLIQDMIVNGIGINNADGIMGGLSLIAIILGLFTFAKQAPKFIREVLGLKGDGNGSLFGGLGMVTGAAVGAAGMFGSAATNWRAAHEEGKALYGDKWGKGFKGFGYRALSAVRTGASTLGGAAGGAYVAGKALAGKDVNPAAVMKAQSARNATRASHSTAPGRFIDSVWSTATGRGLAEHGNKRLEATQNFVKTHGEWNTALQAAAKENAGDTNLGIVKTADGRDVSISGRYEELERAVASTHDGIVTFNGTDYDSNSFTQSFMDSALKATVISYQGGSTKANGDSYAKLTRAGQKLYAKREDARKAYGDVDFKHMPGLDDAIRENGRNYNVDDAGTFGAAIGAANNGISNEQNSMKQRMLRANSKSND